MDETTVKDKKITCKNLEGFHTWIALGSALKSHSHLKEKKQANNCLYIMDIVYASGTSSRRPTLIGKALAF